MGYNERTGRLTHTLCEIRQGHAKVMYGLRLRFWEDRHLKRPGLTTEGG